MKKIASNNYFMYLMGLLFFLMLRPSYTWSNPIGGFAVILFSVAIMWLDPHIDKRKLILTPILFLLYVIGLINDLSVSSLMVSLLFLLFLSSDTAKLHVFKYIRNVYSIILIFSLLVYVVVVWLNVDLPNYEIEASNQLKQYTYYQYPFAVIGENPRGPLIRFRFHYLFDEPGVCGTLACIFLAIDKFRINKWQNVLILISGILSFSMYFYLVFVMSVFLLGKVRKIFCNIYFVIVLSAMAVLFTQSVETETFDFSKLVVERLAVDKDGTLAGDNRSNPKFDKAYDEFYNDTFDVLLGKGVGAHNKIAPGIQTYKMMIYDYGLLYVIVCFSFFVGLAFIEFKTMNRLFFFYIIFLLLFYYQRPAYLYASAEFFLFTLMPAALKYLEKTNIYFRYKSIKDIR